MKEQTFTLELLTDVVLTQSSATEGSHQTLEYVPGATLLGWAAGQLYGKLPGKDSFTVFHSGQVRFGDALPILAPEQVTYPMPLSYHKDKFADKLANLAHSGAEKFDQPKQQRAGFVSSGDLCLRSLKKGARANVSLSRRHLSRRSVQSGSEKNQLFAYQSLAAGQQFRWTLSADDSVADELFQHLVSALDGKKVRLGRSRGVEYGRALVTSCQAPATPEAFSGGDTLSLLLVSDVALRDDNTGQPTYEPTAAAFGLPESASICWEKSFIQTRRYTPFNGKRQRPDLEIQVLRAGSVLTFAGVNGVSVDELQQALKVGVGAYRERGLGQVVVNPPCLKAAAPVLTDWSAPAANSAQAPNESLFAYIKHEHALVEQEAEMFQRSREWAEKLRKYAELPKGPKRAQWGMLRQLAAQSYTQESFYDDLFNKKDGFFHYGVRAHTWYTERGGTKAFAAFQKLVDALSEEEKKTQLPLLVERTSARVLRTMGSDVEGGDAR
jgi:hypothetical protein